MRHTRRDALRAALGASTLLALGPTAPSFLLRAARARAAARDATDRALVVLQLTGGNDGLNTVVPYEDDLYARSRPTLRLRGGDVLKIDGLLGFHPALRGFERLFKEGLLTVVQGAGYPNPNDDHFWSMRFWQSARPDDRFCQTGWLGRALDAAPPEADPVTRGVSVGETAPPFTLNARRSFAPRIAAAGDLALHGFAGKEAGPAPAAPPDGAPALLDFVTRSTLAAYASTRRIEAVAREESSGARAPYPECDLGKMLRITAQLVRADLGIRIFYVTLGGELPGGFDNHAIQAENHAALLRQLSESVAAFADDLARDGTLDRVLLMTFSEFGRTLAENGRHGTGHGSAAPMFLVGRGLAGGLVGPHPSLAALEKGGPAHHTDFRRVYATALDRWLGIDSAAALGGEWEHVAIMAR